MFGSHAKPIPVDGVWAAEGAVVTKLGARLSLVSIGSLMLPADLRPVRSLVRLFLVCLQSYL